jgi:hypothetical protein
MSNQPENENQQYVTPEEVRQFLLTELDASKQVIEELSDEQLEEVAGGGLSIYLKALAGIGKYGKPAESFSMPGRAILRMGKAFGMVPRR